MTKLQAVTISLRKVKDRGKIACPTWTLAEATLRAEEYSYQNAMWSYTNEILQKWAYTCEPDEIAEFAVIYEGGKKWDGTLHLINHPATEAKDRLGYHIKEFCLSYTGP